MVGEHGVYDHDLRKQIKTLVKPFLFSIIVFDMMKLVAIFQDKASKIMILYVLIEIVDSLITYCLIDMNYLANFSKRKYTSSSLPFRQATYGHIGSSSYFYAKKS